MTATANALRQHGTESCGCLQAEAARINGTKSRGPVVHGYSQRPEYAVWKTMRQRCSNPKSADFPDYGGRGIQVCARWADFAAFLSDMGPRPVGGMIDRINNDGNYEKANCRWATAKEQANNRRPRRSA